MEAKCIKRRQPITQALTTIRILGLGKWKMIVSSRIRQLRKSVKAPVRTLLLIHNLFIHFLRILQPLVAHEKHLFSYIIVSPQ